VSLRGRVLAELGTLTLLTVVFLLVFPDRPMGVDVGLALFALALIVTNARYTRNKVWARFPPHGGRPDRRHAFRVLGLWTGLGLAVLLAGTVVAGLVRGEGAGLARRILNPRLLAAIAIYLPWAWLQQTLFQFYLLGRLRVLLEPHRTAAVVITGAAYSLVHLPDVAVMAVTAAAGVVWTRTYDRDRVLSPLALSHAVLGSTFYYWIYGKDLVALWLRLPGSGAP